MTDHELLDLRTRAEIGDRDAVDELVQLAGERGDMQELRRLADGGSRDAAEVLAELTGELDDDPE
jgi:ubiquinone biosynthesis protein UbiJ